MLPRDSETTTVILVRKNKRPLRKKTKMAPTAANEVDNMETTELMKKLEEFGLSTMGSRAVLRERLRNAIEETGQTAAGTANDGVRETKDACDIDSLSKSELVQRLRQLKLPMSGLKATLRERLRAATQREESDQESEDEDEGEVAAAGHNGAVEYNDRGLMRRGTALPSYGDRTDYDLRHDYDCGRVKQPVLTYKDVEDALSPFSGDGTQNVRT